MRCTRSVALALYLLPLIIGCGGRSATENPAIERARFAEAELRSYRLGGIGAFAEMVRVGVKKLALSAPMSPPEMDALIDDARRIAEENGVSLYREVDFMVTDLFPAVLTDGKHVLLIYKDDTKNEYRALKAEKKSLVQAGQYQGSARTDIARRFELLLSYPQERIQSMLRER